MTWERAHPVAYVPKPPIGNAVHDWVNDRLGFIKLTLPDQAESEIATLESMSASLLFIQAHMQVN